MYTLKKLVIFSILLVTIILGWLKSYHSIQHNSQESNIFTSRIYPEYRLKIKDFILNHPLYEKIKTTSTTNYNDKITIFLKELTYENSLGNEVIFHESFLQKLREIISTSVKEDDALGLFTDLVNWLFLKLDLKQELQAFFYTYADKPNDGDFFNYLQEAREMLYKNPKFHGKSSKLKSEDQFLQGNIPSFIANINDTTKLIRIGQPLCQTPYNSWWWSSFKISPEFLLFIKNQPKHLYVNLMKRKGVEGPITKGIEKLEEECKNLYVITLDKNSSFYWQNGQDYPNNLEALRFKQMFFDQMVQPKGNYFWSKHLNLDLWKKELNELLNLVHQLKFNNATYLNRQERQDFIEITYLAILDSLTNKWNPTSMNITCRQGMDRGPSLMVLWMLQKGISNKEELASLLLAPPIIIHNRPSHSSRIERFISAAKRIEKMDH